MNTVLFKKENKRKNDLMFIALFLAAVILFGALYYACREEGDSISVRVDNKFYGEYPLSQDKQIELHSNGGYNLLVIKDGKATVTDASCPDGICSAHRPISREGESIVCLPNKVVVTVNGKSNNKVDISA